MGIRKYLHSYQKIQASSPKWSLYFNQKIFNENFLFLKNLNSFCFSDRIAQFSFFKANDRTIVVSKDGKAKFYHHTASRQCSRKRIFRKNKNCSKRGNLQRKIIIPETKGAILLEGEKS
jgi:pectinesterase